MPGAGGGGSSGYTNMPSWGWSQQNTAPTAAANSAYQQALSWAQNQWKQPYQPYTGKLVAGLTPQQNAALGQLQKATKFQKNVAQPMTIGSLRQMKGQIKNAGKFGRQAAAQAQAGFDTAQQGFGVAQQGIPYAQKGAQLGEQGFQTGLDAYNYGKGWADTLNADNFGGTVSKYMNPYVAAVVDATQKNINETNAQQQQALTSKAIMSGGMGGDRQAVAAAELQREQNLASQATISGLYANGYNQAAANAFNAAGVGEQAAGLGINAGQLGVSAGQNDVAAANAFANMGQVGVGAGGVGVNAANTILGVGNMHLGAANAFNQRAEIANQMGATATASNLAKANAINNWGLMSQNTNQNLLNAQYNQWLRQQNYPFAMNDYLVKTAQGVGPLMGGTQYGQYAGYQPYKQQGSGLSSAIGAGASILGGIASMIPGGGAAAAAARRGGRINKDSGGGLDITGGPQGVGGAMPDLGAGVIGNYAELGLPDSKVERASPLPFGEIIKPPHADAGESQSPDYGGLGKSLGSLGKKLFSGSGDSANTDAVFSAPNSEQQVYRRGGRVHYSLGGADDMGEDDSTDVPQPTRLALDGRKMSDADRDLAIRTIYGEAGHEPDLGQAAVAHVIRNRMLANEPQYGGNSLRGVIMKPKQFSLWNAGDRAGDVARKLPADSPAYRHIGDLIDKVNSGEIPDPTGGSKNYYNPHAAHPAWGDKLAKLGDVTIGNHRFVGGTGEKPTIGDLPRVAANDKLVPQQTSSDASPTDLDGLMQRLTERALRSYTTPQGSSSSRSSVDRPSKLNSLGQALMSFGFATMAGNSPIAAQNIGRGALEGLATYRHLQGLDESPAEAEARQLQMENLRSQMGQRNALMDTQRLNQLMELLKYQRDTRALEGSNTALRGVAPVTTQPPPTLDTPTLTAPTLVGKDGAAEGAAPAAGKPVPPAVETGKPMDLPGAPREAAPAIEQKAPPAGPVRTDAMPEGMRPAAFDPNNMSPGDAEFLKNAPEYRKSVEQQQSWLDEAKRMREAGMQLRTSPTYQAQGEQMLTAARQLEQQAAAEGVRRQAMVEKPMMVMRNGKVAYEMLPSYVEATNKLKTGELESQTPALIDRARKEKQAALEVEDPFKLAEENRKVKATQAESAQNAIKMQRQLQQLRDAYFDPQTGKPRVAGGAGVIAQGLHGLADILGGIPGASPEVVKSISGTDPNNLQQVRALGNLLGAEFARLNLPGQRIAQQEFMRLSSMGPGEHMTPDTIRLLIDHVFLPASQREIEKYDAIRKADPRKDDFHDVMFDVERKWMNEGSPGPESKPVGIDQVAAPKASPKAPPKAGEIRNGYRFKGGNPGNKASWEKVNG